MSQDVIADCLNEIMNAKRARKQEVTVKRYSRLLLNILEVAKKHGYVESYKVRERELEIKFKLNECKAIKPRFDVKTDEIEKYTRRYLPARGFGIIVISTSRGLMTHEECLQENIGGCLIAYFY